MLYALDRSGWTVQGAEAMSLGGVVGETGLMSKYSLVVWPSWPYSADGCRQDAPDPDSRRASSTVEWIDNGVHAVFGAYECDSEALFVLERLRRAVAAAFRASPIGLVLVNVLGAVEERVV